MPSTSAKQAKFMRAVANSPKFAKKVGVSQSVGKDFEMADKKAKKFGDGGSARKPKPPMPREPITGGPDTVPLTPERKKFLEELRRRQQEGAVASKGAKPTKKPSEYAKGGKVMKKATKAGKAMVKKSADTMGRAMVKKKAMGGKCYAKGGSVASKRADGCAVKGKTKGKMLAMGGMAGRGMMAEDMGGPAMMSMPGYKKGGKTGYKRGGKTC